MIKISIIENPDRKISQSILYFQFRFMGFSEKDLITQDDQYGSLPFAFVVAQKNNKIIGVINLLKREVDFQGAKIKLGGIGGVCVHQDYRRQKIASKMLDKGMAYLKNQGLDVVILCTDTSKLGKLYSSVGFRLLKKEYVATGASGHKYLGKGGMVAPLNSEEKFSLLLSSSKQLDLQGQDW